jgi:Histidine kinase-, DNA gyrase B-, and HSP90-like ATPase
MTESRQPRLQVPIRPGVSVLALFKHLNYKPWYAMAEFVDNSLQSFLANREQLGAAGTDRLKVEIEVDGAPPTRIVIRDDAAGIALKEFPRAFRPADPPPDQTGLAEFGVGMKSAACWFAAKWSVRTKALGEEVERTVEFDVDRIVEDSIENLEPKERLARSSDHYTEITLTGLHQSIQPRTITRIKDHLASIYRQFERNAILRIVFGQDTLLYQSPEVLIAPPFRTPSAPPVTWRKDIAIDLGEGMKVKGWAGIRRVASTSLAGFALFRRDRLIVGSGDETYRPEAIFGHSNSYTYQRLFGEFQVEGVDISHTKDGFQWEGHEDQFLQKLRTSLNDPNLPLLAQAEGYRARAKTEDLAQGAQTALEATAVAIEQYAGPVLETHSSPIQNEHLPQGLPQTPKPHLAGLRVLKVVFHGVEWTVRIDLSNDPGIGTWLMVTIPARLEVPTRPGGVARRELSLRMALAHPFMVRYGGASSEDIEPLIRVGVALGLAEVVAREAGVRNPSAIRDAVNDLLRDALSRPV